MSTTADLPRLLCVDDEPNVLDALQRTLMDDYDVTTAASGAAGLECVQRRGPFAVVVSDMRMPNMDGAEFLAKVRAAAPDTVRVLLTGQASVAAAVQAVNGGGIFRFLLKPASEEALQGALRDAVQQYRLVTAERDLLENTLKQTVEVLTEVLSMASPLAFDHARRLNTYAQYALRRLAWAAHWEYEVAILLSQIGYITAPVETLERSFSGQALTADERQMMRRLPGVASELVARIPRLDRVAAIISGAQGARTSHDPIVVRGVKLLAIVSEFDRLLHLGRTPAQAIESLRARSHEDRLVDALVGFGDRTDGQEVVVVRRTELDTTMAFVGDVVANNGITIVRAGSSVTPLMLRRLENFAEGVGLPETFEVFRRS